MVAVEDCYLDIQIVPRPVEAVGFDSFPDTAGAECQFIGRTRRESHADHGVLKRLSYDAYEEMAMQVLHDLAQRAATRFGCLAIRLHHATGEVAPGEGSVLIQVITGHRGESFDACRFLIDELKASVPIWKREEWEDGTTWSQGTPARAPENH